MYKEKIVDGVVFTFLYVIQDKLLICYMVCYEFIC